nr:immunoglobulin light chain junction region [Macaca mulatta]
CEAWDISLSGPVF